MMHIDLTSKRARLAFRFFTYGVMTLATAVLTVLAVFYAMGYRFNQNDLSFTQGGLIRFQSLPDGADVFIDGQPQSFTTPGRANLSAGSHTIEMRLNGYRSWQKTVVLAPGQLLWLDYARLLPNTITTTQLANFDDAAGALTSPDHKWIIVQTKTDQPQFKLVNLGDPKRPAVSDFTVPEAQLTKKDGSYGQFILKEWDAGSRYVLVEHTVKDVHETLRIDRERAANTVNVSRLFGLNVVASHFAGTNPNLLYAKTDTVLRSLDISTSGASAALVTGVGQFMVYENGVVAFTASREASGASEQVAGLYTQGKEVIARHFAADAHIQVAYAEYARHSYLAIDSGDGTVHIVRDPTTASNGSPEVTTINLGKPVAWLNFNDLGRILALGNGNTVATYDLDLDKFSTWTIPGADTTQPLQWLDDYYLWADNGNMLRIFEYDNTNSRDITSVSSGLTVSLSTDGTRLFSFERGPTGAIELQGSQLTTQNQ